MKEIKAIIQPFRLSEVVDALKGIDGLPGVTVSEVRGFGKNQARDSENKIVDDGIEYVVKAKLEIVVPDAIVEEVVETICERARTGRPGDGKIFVSRVEEVVKVRTGGRGESAI